MRRYLTLVVMTITILVAGASFATAAPKARQENKESQEQARLAREAKITMEQARETALKRAPGNIESSELEREHGKLVYSFDIRNSKGTITEVQVSAMGPFKLTYVNAADDPSKGSASAAPKKGAASAKKKSSLAPKK